MRNKEDKDQIPTYRGGTQRSGIEKKVVVIQILKMFSYGFAFAFCAAVVYYLKGVALAQNETIPQRPHIIFIVADDLGWNDVSFHGSPQIPTPNLDALASSGIMLNNYYAQFLCSPSRGALMTGKYPIRLGLQHFVIRANEPSALPLEVNTMPQYFKDLGYATHMVGKWHLGCKKKEYLPTLRGFDTFFGYCNGYIDYYDYTHLAKSRTPPYKGYHQEYFFGIDLRNGTKVVKDVRGQYATELFTDKANDIIQNHNASEPLLLYFSHLAVHNGNAYMPLQAPIDIVNQFNHIKSGSRRIYAGMAASMDESVGKVFEALHNKDMLSNTILVFVSDNGGESNRTANGYSSNYPLRGQKFLVWEGGIRVPAFIWSPLLKLQQSRISQQLMHITDWLPTLYKAAGGDIKNLGDIDGQNIWDALVTNSPSPRVELLHNIDPINNISSFRSGDLKLITGNLTSGLETWDGKEVLEDMSKPQSMDGWVFKNGSIVKDILVNMGLYLPQTDDTWRLGSEIECNGTPETANECNPLETPCLFNITADPCEMNNIAFQYPEIVRSMLNNIKAYEKQAVKPQFQDIDPHGDPMCHGFAYVSWQDPEHITNCPLS
ncbi:arylsulfatase B [Nephila pilipes]|uniref:Arylsulfatase B n=1 Tax=Nephila pilipes TaxID=299642 RepID=A0A8X6NYG1_NEPPI|nr:arylsulfatase B [Nephila pilipes]